MIYYELAKEAINLRSNEPGSGSSARRRARGTLKGDWIKLWEKAPKTGNTQSQTVSSLQQNQQHG